MAGLVVALLSVALLAGCVSQAKQENRLPMVVGIVNVDLILPQLPEYREYSDKYQKERQELFKGMKPDPKSLNSFMTPDKKKEIEKSVQKWDELKRKFLDQTMDKIRTAANKVARDKHIDIVLVNSPWFPVGERMAVDITTDVIIALKESGQAAH